MIFFYGAKKIGWDQTTMIYYHLFYGAKQIGRAQTRDQLLVIMLKLKDKEEHTGQGLSNVISRSSFSNRDDLI